MPNKITRQGAFIRREQLANATRKTAIANRRRIQSIDTIKTMQQLQKNTAAMRSLPQRPVVALTGELKALSLQNQRRNEPSIFNELASIGRAIQPDGKDALKLIKKLDVSARAQRTKKTISTEQFFRIQSIITGKLLTIAKNPRKVGELNRSLINQLVGPESGKDVIKAMNKTLDGNLEARLINLKLPDVPNHKPEP